MDGPHTSAGATKRTQYFWYHYVLPRKLVHVDHRAVHERLDRMVNAAARAGAAGAKGGESAKARPTTKHAIFFSVSR